MADIEVSAAALTQHASEIDTYMTALREAAAAGRPCALSGRVVAWSLTSVRYMNCWVMACVRSGAWRTCFFSTISSL